MHEKLEEKYADNKPLLDEKDRLIIQNIESSVKSLLEGVGEQQLEMIVTLDKLLLEERSLRAKQEKILAKTKIISTLIADISKYGFEELAVLKPFEHLNDAQDSCLCLQDIFRDASDVDTFTNDLRVYEAKNNNQIESFARNIDKVRQELNFLYVKMQDFGFEIAIKYLAFKQKNNYFFEIGPDKQLLKISRKGAGPKFSILYPSDQSQNQTQTQRQGQESNQPKMILYSGKARCLGRGGYGLVKLTQDYYTHELYAVKIQSTTREQKECKLLLDREVENLGKVGMLHNYAYMPTRKKHYISMQLVSGTDSFEIIANKYCDDPRGIAKVLLANAKALQQFHDGNMIHRDIKLENFVYDEQTDTSKLIDFSFLVDHVHGDQVHRSAEYLGTPEFRASEIEDAHEHPISAKRNGLVDETINKAPSYPYSKRSDIYSFGCILHQVENMIPQKLAHFAASFKMPFSERPLNLHAFIDAAQEYLNTIPSKNKIGDSQHKKPRVNTF